MINSENVAKKSSENLLINFFFLKKKKNLETVFPTIVSQKIGKSKKLKIYLKTRFQVFE